MCSNHHQSMKTRLHAYCLEREFGEFTALAFLYRWWFSHCVPRYFSIENDSGYGFILYKEKEELRITYYCNIQ